MNLQKLAETVLYQLEHFWLLQELDEACRTKNSAAEAFLDKVYSHRSARWADLIPFVRLNTVLSSLLVPLSYAARFSDEELRALGFTIKAEYELSFKRNSTSEPPTARLVLRTLRNAVAHLPDFAAGEGEVMPNVSFDQGILRCISETRDQTYELVFDTECGFIQFLRDLLRAIKKATSSKNIQAGDAQPTVQVDGPNSGGPAA